MKVVIAPNSFKNVLSAYEVASILSSAAKKVDPSIEIKNVPLADGGDGTLDCLKKLMCATEYSAEVNDPAGELIPVPYAITDDGKTGIIEMASINGDRLRSMPLELRTPLHYSTYGVGQLVKVALDHNISELIIGAGGSITIDAGMGALSALGAVFLDEDDNELQATPDQLGKVCKINLSQLDTRLKNIKITMLGDVFTPLINNVKLYGQQKGVDVNDIHVFDEFLANISDIIDHDNLNLLKDPWLGAGGGIAGGFATILGAEVVSGANFIINASDLNEELENCDFVFTGEGRLDATSFQGKLPTAVSDQALFKNVPTIIIANQIDWDGIQNDLKKLTYCFCTMKDFERNGDHRANLGNTMKNIIKLLQYNA